MAKRRKARAPEPAPAKAAAFGRPALALLAFVVVAGVSVLAWRARNAPTAFPPVRDNLLLVTLDTTRADRLGCYGYAPAKTRHLDRLAAEGVRFERAYASAPITLPSHASIFTGLYPFEHGVRNNGNFYLADRYDTLATVLKAQGYRTAAFVSAFILDRRYGLASGFDTYDDRMEGAQPQILALEAERRGDRTALALSRWLDNQATQPAAPFFAWLHLYDPHEPYRPPSPFREVFAANPYDGEISFDDAAVASILDKLSGLGQLDHTLVAVVADHGESLGDHGEETHSMFVYESAIRIPMILWRPGRIPAGAVVRAPVRSIDLAPTLLGLLGAPSLKTPHARSLIPLIEGKAARAPAAYAETFLPKFYMNWAPLRALADERYKLIDAPRPELYDLGDDPGEARNRWGEQGHAGSALRGELDRLTAGSEGVMASGSLDREAAEKLAALGYIGAGSEPQPPLGVVPRDPKDVIGVFNRLRRANSAVRDRRFSEALPILHEVLSEDPKNAFARLVLGSAHMGMGHYAQAIEQYRKYVALVPTSSYAHQWMAICYLNLNDRTGALREADAALAIDAKFTDARVLRAGVLAARGEHPAAIEELRTAVAIDPQKAALRLDLAKVLAEAGRTDDARAEYEAALKQQPDFGPALVGLASLDAASGAFDAAERHLRRALDIDSTQLETRLNLARILEMQGRTVEAAAEYRRVEASAADPAFRAAAQKRLAALSSRQTRTK